MKVTVRIKTAHGRHYSFYQGGPELSVGSQVDGDWREFTLDVQQADRLRFVPSLLVEDVVPLKKAEVDAAFLRPL
jgi:hypothetical protein